ncbi:manganese efflux pump [Methylocystis sp. JAN1]|uniref:manganese efflux pump n=1 Tax=Methylocystis sp. JAN1 TaxID=3397211 RepID=UPI003FA2AD14
MDRTDHPEPYPGASSAPRSAATTFTPIAATLGALAAALLLAASLLSSGAHFSPPLQHLLSAAVIALANNVDNLGARLAYSVQGTRLSVAVNVWISAITLLVSAAAAYFGGVVILFFGKFLASFFAMAMLVSLGLWMILHARLQSWHERIHEEKSATRRIHILKKPHDADIDGSKHIDFAEGTVLGLALSVNNVGGGVAAGVLGVNPMLVGFLSAVVSFLALWAGNYVAAFFIRRRISDKAALAGGAALILIGLKQLM